MELPPQKRNSEFIEINKESLQYRSKNEHKTPSMIFGVSLQLEKISRFVATPDVGSPVELPLTGGSRVQL
jgi:hypothetical protein